MKFTEQIAQYISDSGLDTRHLTIVLPSERARKYIAAALYNQDRKALIAPEMVTIDRWVKSLVSKTVIDKTRALVRLFDIQLQQAKDEKDRSFDEFLEWGPILLSDFDEIDRYMLSPKQVFRNLSDIKELESWQVDESTLSESRKRFMEFWDRLPGYYEALNQQLNKEGWCYMGAAYKELAENIDRVFREDKERHFIFAGFNALSAAEISIMKQLHKMGRGHILIDADKFYLNRPTHEAGQFIRQLITELQVKELPFVSDSLEHEEKHIEVIECPQTTGQVKVMRTQLAQMSGDQLENTLLLLADESLITPLLKNLPASIGQANITLGMPLRNSALRNWVELVFMVQENKRRFRTEAFYHSDLLRLISHPFVVNCAGEKEMAALQALEQNMLRHNKIFIAPRNVQLGEGLDELFELLAMNWDGDWNRAMQTIRQMNGFLFKSLNRENQFERALVEGFDRALIDFGNCVQEGLPEMSLRSFKNLFHQHWSTKSIAYHGNPITGLQIMGLLETRLLDFEHILCLGLNEGTMPPTNPIQTMLPMDLRRYLQLPTPREKQGLFAHHFYRLLHHCKHMLVTFTSASEAIGSNERSRYLLQLELELQRINPKVRFEHKYYTIPATEEKSVRTTIPKTPEIINRMDELFAASTSITALKNFFTCPLDFYYKYILEFGEEDAVEEEVEHSTFGTFVHDTLEKLFGEHARRGQASQGPERATNLTTRDLDLMMSKAESVLRSIFLDHFDQDAEAFSSGKNLLSFRMALEMILNYLKEEKKFLAEGHEVYIEAVEEKIEHDLDIQVNGKTKRLHLKGIIDRIDRVDGKIRIVDYKTGAVTATDVTIAAGQNKTVAEKIVESKHALQLLTYCYLYTIRHGALPDESGIVPLVNIRDGFMPLEVKTESLQHWVDAFPALLTELMETIYDPGVPFEHEEKGWNSYCNYCK